MPRHVDVTLSGDGLRIAIAVARFNQAVTMPLLDGAVAALAAHGVADDAIDVAFVPGAFELPLCAQRLAAMGRYDGIVCLGAVVRGETPHFDYVAGEAATALMRVSLQQDIPIAFGVLTTDTMEQALERVSGTAHNKGWEATLTVLDLIEAGL